MYRTNISGSLITIVNTVSMELMRPTSWKNHTVGGKHKLGVSLPCLNLGCSKMFNSVVFRDRHMKFCGVAKCLKCQYCKKVYKREANLKKHDEVIHQKIGTPFYCKLCQHTYQSKTAYSSHYKNKQE